MNLDDLLKQKQAPLPDQGFTDVVMKRVKLAEAKTRKLPAFLQSLNGSLEDSFFIAAGVFLVFQFALHASDALIASVTNDLFGLGLLCMGCLYYFTTANAESEA